jgi:hypothetical protein
MRANSSRSVETDVRSTACSVLDLPVSMRSEKDLRMRELVGALTDVGSGGGGAPSSSLDGRLGPDRGRINGALAVPDSELLGSDCVVDALFEGFMQELQPGTAGTFNVFVCFPLRGLSPLRLCLCTLIVLETCRSLSIGSDSACNRAAARGLHGRCSALTRTCCGGHFPAPVPFGDRCLL